MYTGQHVVVEARPTANHGLVVAERAEREAEARRKVIRIGALNLEVRIGDDRICRSQAGLSLRRQIRSWNHELSGREVEIGLCLVALFPRGLQEVANPDSSE